MAVGNCIRGCYPRVVKNDTHPGADELVHLKFTLLSREGHGGSPTQIDRPGLWLSQAKTRLQEFGRGGAALSLPSPPSVWPPRVSRRRHRALRRVPPRTTRRSRRRA